MESTTEGKLYLVELTAPFERLEIQFYPAEITESRRIEVAETKGVVGWNHTGTHYTGGDDVVSFDLLFYSDDAQRVKAVKSFRWLQSLGQSNAGRAGQPEIAIVWGGLYKNQRFTLLECSGTLADFYQNNNNRPSVARVSVKFKRQAPARPTPFSDKRKWS